MTVVALHRDRAATIGGSDIAAAAGIDPHRSRIMLWLEKTGRYSRSTTEAMRWGTLLEPVIVERLRSDGFDIHYPFTSTLADPDREWLAGHPDGFVELDDGTGLLEVKTSNSFAHRSNGDGPALHYVAQVQLYLHLTDHHRALLATLVNGQYLETHEIARDDRAIALLLDAAERMHWHVVTDTQPPVDGSESAREALSLLYPESSEARRVRLDSDGMRDVRELRARKEQANAVDAQVTALENRLKARMGEAEYAVSPSDDDVLRWSTVTTHRIQTTALKVAHPAIAEAFTVPTTSRRFTVL